MNELSPTYKPVPVTTAREIAERFEKDAVLILAVDKAHACTHHTTYGTTAAAKRQIAGMSEAINAMLTGGVKLQTFEDFRNVPVAELTERIGVLESQLTCQTTISKIAHEDLNAALKHQCNSVISRVDFIPGGMGPDMVLVTMITGQVLQIGLEGVNLYETRGCLQGGDEPLGGLVFPR